MAEHAPLTREETARAMTSIAHWRQDTTSAIACPCCLANGAGVADLSARPYTEWYRITCPACGLDATLAIPLGPGVPGHGY